MTAQSVITDTKVFWDKAAGRLYVYNSDTNSWELFFTAAGGVSTQTLDAALALKLDKAGGDIADDLTVGGKLALGGAELDSNALVVAGESSLFTNSAGSLRFFFSKNASTDDAALTFETNFSARALIGLLGDDNVTVKVTPDGANYYTAFVIDKDNGQLSFEQLVGTKRTFPAIAAGTLLASSSYVNPSNGGTVDTIGGGFDGALLIVQATGGAITFTNAGNIKTPGAADLVLSDWNDTALFVCNGGGTWLALSMSNN